ncbi:hypothetical protein [Klebsiella quasipneumoniae]|uniref:hypothetical protein n=1 Tax=Klebsiella quasipneumoniae TaxID=1463165 RepID=UPI003B43483A
MKTQPATGETYPKSDLFNKAYAEVNNENLGTATEKLLQLAFQLEASADEAGVTEEDIDSQHTEEEATPLTPKEIKALRKLLKKKK